MPAYYALTYAGIFDGGLVIELKLALVFIATQHAGST